MGTTEDEMVGWSHRLNGHEFESLAAARRPAGVSGLIRKGKGEGVVWEETPAAPAASEIFITLDSTITFSLLKENQNKACSVLGVTLQAWLAKDERSGFKSSLWL